MRGLPIFRPALLAAILATFATASADQLVANGGFEAADGNGVFGAGWDFSSLYGYQKAYLFDDFTGPAYGGYFPEAPPTVTAFLGYEDGNTDTILQSIDTVGYGSATLTLDVKTDGFDPLGFDFLTITFGNDLIAKIDMGSPDETPYGLAPSYDLSPYFDGTTKSLSITVSLDDRPHTNTYVWVDNVSITAQAVPEPASLAALAFGALALVRRRREQNRP